MFEKILIKKTLQTKLAGFPNHITMKNLTYKILVKFFSNILNILNSLTIKQKFSIKNQKFYIIKSIFVPIPFLQSFSLDPLDRQKVSINVQN